MTNTLEIGNEKTKFSKAQFFRRYSGLFVMSAVLPIVLGFVLGPQGFTYFSRAERKLEMRVWIEPSTTVSRPHFPVNYKILAELSDDKSLVSNLNLNVTGEPGTILDPQIITHPVPFTGKTVLGEFQATGTLPGKFTLSIPETDVKFNVVDKIQVITGNATLIIRE